MVWPSIKGSLREPDVKGTGARRRKGGEVRRPPIPVNESQPRKPEEAGSTARYRVACAPALGPLAGARGSGRGPVTLVATHVRRHLAVRFCLTVVYRYGSSLLADWWSIGVGEIACNIVCFIDAEFWHRSELRTAAWEGPGDVEMEVGDGLVCRRSVVLPDGYAWAFVNVVDPGGRCSDRVDQRMARGSRCFEKSCAVAGWNHKNVSDAALLSGDEHGDQVGATHDRVGPSTGKVVAERARVLVRELNAGVGHHAAKELRNDWNSTGSTLCCSEGWMTILSSLENLDRLLRSRNEKAISLTEISAVSSGILDCPWPSSGTQIGSPLP